MINFLICLIISVILTFGMATALVEKGNEWPIRPWRIRIQAFIHDHIYWKFAQVFWCQTCISFWLSLISDIIIGTILYLNNQEFYFFFPFSGFIAMGFCWFIIEFLNSIDKETTIVNMISED